MPKRREPAVVPPDVRQAMRQNLYQEQRAKEILGELASRRSEALKLYEPSPFQQRFHASRAKEVACIKGNQVGGSLALYAELARALTGQDPHGKYPKENGKAVAIGYGEDHIGRVIFPYLFMPGAFKVIRDLETREWRTYRPWPMAQGGDLERADEAKKSPPLVPKRFIKGKIAWEDRGKRIFKRVEFINGWELEGLNSRGDPKNSQGYQIDLACIDEDMAKEGWYDELLARATMRKGYLRWAAMPHDKNDELLNLMWRAEDESKKDHPRTEIIRATIFDNPYLPEESRKENLRIFASQGEDVVRRRAYGELCTESRLMYPAFSESFHNAVKFEEPRLLVQKLLTERQGEPPNDWCRYVSIDPGHSIAAATFWAIPPEGIGDFAVCYDEIYLTNATAATFADAMQMKTRDRVIQEFILDMHGGRLREIGSGLQPWEQYKAAFEARGIASVATGSSFTPGCDNIKAREGMLRAWMEIRHDGTSKFLVVVGKCPNLVRELKRFRKKTAIVNGAEVVSDEGNRRGGTHAIETCEYAAAHGLRYVKPKQVTVELTPYDRMILADKRRRLKAMKNAALGSGGGIVLGPVGDWS